MVSYIPNLPSRPIPDISFLRSRQRHTDPAKNRVAGIAADLSKRYPINNALALGLMKSTPIEIEIPTFFIQKNAQGSFIHLYYNQILETLIEAIKSQKISLADVEKVFFQKVNLDQLENLKTTIEKASGINNYYEFPLLNSRLNLKYQSLAEKLWSDHSESYSVVRIDSKDLLKHAQAIAQNLRDCNVAWYIKELSKPAA